MDTNFNAAKKFSEFGFNSKKQGLRESASGPGSTKNAASVAKNCIDNLIMLHNIHSVLDLGCGDFNWFNEICKNHLELRYIGWDANIAMIDELTEEYGSDTVSFEFKDIVVDAYPTVDLIICRDVLFHLTTEIAETVVDNVMQSGASYFVSTTYPTLAQNDKSKFNEYMDIVGWGFKPINLDIAPFNLAVKKQMQTEESSIAKANGHARYIGVYKI